MDQSCSAMCGNSSGLSYEYFLRYSLSLVIMRCHSKIFLLNHFYIHLAECKNSVHLFCSNHRFSCVPVDFEVVNVNSSSTSEDDINNAIMAIRRNGVALKGLCIQLLIDNVKILPLLLVRFYTTNCLYINNFLFFFSQGTSRPTTQCPLTTSQGTIFYGKAEREMIKQIIYS